MNRTATIVSILLTLSTSSLAAGFKCEDIKRLPSGQRA